MIDVIIPTKNSAETLDACLHSLKQQVYPVNVIIVDAYSTDTTRKIARKYNATIIDEPLSNIKGSRRAVACNEGLRHATTDIVAFLDSDTEVPKTWSRDMCSAIQTTELVAGVTSGCVKNDSTKLAKAINTILNLSTSHAKNFEYRKELDSIPGYNAAYKKRVLFDVGLFNEEIGGCEDWELNYRIRNAGYKLMSVPTSPVVHHERKTMSAFAKQMRGYGWSRGRLFSVAHIFTPLHMLPAVIMLSTAFYYPEGTYLFLLGLFLYNLCKKDIDDIIEKLPSAVVLLLTGIVFSYSWMYGYIDGLSYR